MLQQRAWWVLAFVALPGLASVQTGRKLRRSEPVDCTGSPAHEPDHYIVGVRAYQWFAQRNLTHLTVPAWDKNNPVRVTKGCSFNYRLHFFDEVHLVIEKELTLSEIWFEYDQERQPGATQWQSMAFFTAWEEFMPYYNSLGGIPYRFELMNYVFLDAGEATFDSDQHVYVAGEQRDDMYHWKNSTARRLGDRLQADEHMGDLRICLFASLADQMKESVYKTWELIFTGTSTWHEHPPTGKIRLDQYNALKAFYQEACAPYRGPNPPAFDKPWVTDWSRDDYLQQVSTDRDYVPYCTWLMDGWNDTYWSQYLDTDGGACHMIEGVWCDDEGYIDEVHLSHRGLQGDFGKLLNSLTEIRNVDIKFNALKGTLPKFLESSKKLRKFDIWHNLMTGTVPCFDSNQLWSLDLSYNRLTGTLPTCPNGEDVHDNYFEHNDLTGVIPKDWKRYVNYRNMYFQYNRITGSIPVEICNLTNLFAMNIEGNLLTGSIPDDCLANQRPREGLFNLYSLDASHNRFSGGLPRINGNRGHALTMGGAVRFSHNFLTGTYTDQWDEYFAHFPGYYIGTRFGFKDNLLSGPLPEGIRVLAMKYAGGIEANFFAWTFENNFFRCEPDGRWPDWVNRMIDAPVSQDLGKCLPVAHPTSVPAEPLTEGQVAMLTVRGSDFVARGNQRCRFVSSGGSTVITASIRETDTLIRCLVPADIKEGTYKVQVSNFGDDWSSTALIEGYVGDPTIEVVEAPVSSTSSHLNVSMSLTTSDSGSITQATVQSMITEMFGPNVEVSNFAAGPAPSSPTRRLQAAAGNALVVTFLVRAMEGQVVSMKDKLEDKAEVEKAFRSTGVNVVVTEVSARGLMVSNTAGSTSEDKTVDPILIIVACVTLVVACGLCGFIVFLYRMERSGKAYFKETLEDNEPSASAAPPQKIGVPADEAAGNDV